MSTEIVAVEKISKSPFRISEVSFYIHHIDGEIVGYEIYDYDILKDWFFISVESLNQHQISILKEELDKVLKREIA